MPYVFKESQAGELLPATDFPSLTSEVLTETFAQTFEENPIAALSRAKELSDDYREGERLDAATARQKLADRGMEHDITVNDAGITQAALDTLMFRKGVEKRRQEVYGLAEGGFAQGAARLGIGLATSLIDPVSVATAFIPVVGEARYLSWLGRAGGIAGRTGIRAGVGAIEGVAGAALLEPIIAGSRRYEQADYDMADSLLNVAFGGLFGAGLHSTFGAVSDGVTHYTGAEAPWRGLENLTPDESRLVLNMRDEIDGGMDARDIARTTETWSEPMRRAIEREAPKAPTRSPAEAAHQSLPPITKELAVKQAIVQAVMDEPINVAHIVEGAADRQIQAPDFQRWFAGSRAVDERGAPVVVHAGDARFITDPLLDPNQELDRLARGERTLMDFSTNAADSAMAVYISAKNPATEADVAKAIKTMERRQLPDRAAFVASQVATAGLISKAAVYAGYVSGTDNSKLLPKFLSEFPDEVFTRSSAEVINLLKKRGFDSIRRRDSWTVFDASQVRTAIQKPPRTGVERGPDFAAYAEKVLAREITTGEPTADRLKMAQEEESLARSDLKALADRLGLEAEDAELREVMEGAERAAHWARAAELATVCLVRGG